MRSTAPPPGEPARQGRTDRPAAVLRRSGSPCEENRRVASLGSPPRMPGSPDGADPCAGARQAAPTPDEACAAGSAAAGADAATHRPTPHHRAVLGASTPDAGGDDAPAASGEALGDAAPGDAPPRPDHAAEDAAADEGRGMSPGDRRLASPRSADEPPARSRDSAQVEHGSRHAASLRQDGTAPTAVLQKHDLPLREPSQYIAANLYSGPGDAALVEFKRRHRSPEERRARRDAGKLQSTVDESEPARVFSRPDPRILFAPVDLNHL